MNTKFMKEIFLFLIVLILFNSSNVYALSDFSFSDISPDDFFGYDVEIIGDLDGDGVTDIAVGAPYDNDGGKSPFGPHGGGGASCAFAIPLSPIVNNTVRKTFFMSLPFWNVRSVAFSITDCVLGYLSFE